MVSWLWRDGRRKERGLVKWAKVMGARCVDGGFLVDDGWWGKWDDDNEVVLERK